MTKKTDKKRRDITKRICNAEKTICNAEKAIKQIQGQLVEAVPEVGINRDEFNFLLGDLGLWYRALGSAYIEMEFLMRHSRYGAKGGRPLIAEIGNAIEKIEAAPRGKRRRIASDLAQTMGTQPETLLRNRSRRKQAPKEK